MWGTLDYHFAPHAEARVLHVASEALAQMHWTAHSAFPADMCSGAASAMLHGLASQPGRVRARAVLVSSAYPKVVVEAASQCRLPHACWSAQTTVGNGLAKPLATMLAEIPV